MNKTTHRSINKLVLTLCSQPPVKRLSFGCNFDLCVDTLCEVVFRGPAACWSTHQLRRSIVPFVTSQRLALQLSASAQPLRKLERAKEEQDEALGSLRIVMTDLRRASVVYNVQT